MKFVLKVLPSIFTSLMASKEHLPLTEHIEMRPDGSEVPRKPGVQKTYHKYLVFLIVWLAIVSALLLCVTVMVTIFFTSTRTGYDRGG